MMDSNMTLGIVLLVGAVSLIAWGAIGIVQYVKEGNSMRDFKEPSTGAKTHTKLVRKLKEL